MYELFTTEYMGTIPDDLSVCYVSRSVYTRLLDTLEANRIFAIFSFPCGATRYCAVQFTLDTHNHYYGDNVKKDPIYVPLWMLPPDAPIGEEIQVDFLSQEAFPEATSITLRPLDSAFYNTDAREELTGALTRLGVLRVGDTVMIPLKSLDGYTIGFYVSACSPADTVLMEGDEVAIEFEEASDLWDGRRPATPPPPPVSPPGGEVLSSILPVEPEMASGEVLGGAPVRRMANGRAWNPYR
jgi:hypothetical protein